jgi:transposase
VRTTIRRFEDVSLGWPLRDGLTDAALEASLLLDAGTKRGPWVGPDWSSIHRELKRNHVTLSILWDEDIESNPEGYARSTSVATSCLSITPATPCR